MHEVLVNCLFKLAQEKAWLSDRPAMTIAADLGRKATKQTTKSNTNYAFIFFFSEGVNNWHNSCLWCVRDENSFKIADMTLEPKVKVKCT